MLLTEEEARTKWCPHVRDLNDESSGNTAYNFSTKEGRNPEFARCIASDCTQWRWHCSPENVDVPEYGQKPTGYCGLSGPVKE